jgi:hypothetical protein
MYHSPTPVGLLPLAIVVFALMGAINVEGVQTVSAVLPPMRYMYPLAANPSACEMVVGSVPVNDHDPTEPSVGLIFAN